MALELVDEEKADLKKIPSTTFPTSINSVQSSPDENETPITPPDGLALGTTSPVAPKPKKSFRFKLTITFLCVVSLVASIDAVIVAACLAAIAEDLGGDSLKTFWVGTSFLLAQTVTVPIYGTLSDIFGRKWLILTAIGTFLLGSILCATAKSMEWLIGARVVSSCRRTLHMLKVRNLSKD